MKLSHLSLAIFSAIALAACGGSGSSTEIKPDPKPDPKPEETTPVKNEEVIVDPAQTGVVGKLDFSKESSVGTTQYIRGEKSKYDRIDNPKEATTATSIYGVSVDEQNPYLTNIALARLKDKKNPKQTLVQYFGNNPNIVSELKNQESLQQQNKHNVVLDDAYLSTAAQVTNETVVKGQLQRLENILEKYEEDEDALTPKQKEDLKKLRKVQEELELVIATFDENKKYGVNRYILEKGVTRNWGDGLTTAKAALDQGKGNAPVAVVAADPQTIGLVGINYDADNRSPNEYKKGRIRGTEEKSMSSTRIFGRNFGIEGGAVKWNSYLGAETVVPAAKISNFGGGAIADLNAAEGLATAAGARLDEGVEWELAAVPNKLEYIQYGRVTGNLDPVKFSKKDIESGEEFVFKRMDFLNKKDPKAVDTYFYRGPDVTTAEEMKEVAAGGKALTYRGHALMYGIDNEFHNKTPRSVPTAFGKSAKHGIGNFVEAKVDLAKEKLEEGYVYNVWQSDQEHAIAKDVLVTFSGNIYGNTVIGEAQRTYNTSDKADFRGSFFGKNADELGGSFNSTTWQERYGAKGDVWGGVFGSKRVEEVSSDLSNQQLGDIPAVTVPPKKTAETTQNP